MEIVMYKGHRILEIKETPDERFPLRLGYKKAIRILQHLEEIQQFVTEEAKLIAEEGNKTNEEKTNT